MPKTINLIRGVKKEDKKFLQKLFLWTITGGKSLIIIIEILVITILLFRFGLEKTTDSAMSEATERKETIESFGDLESNFLDYQKRLDLISKVRMRRRSFAKPLQGLPENMPENVYLQDLTINYDNSKITAQARDTISFAKLIDSLLNLEGIDKIVLEGAYLDSKLTNEYTLTISVVTNEKFF